MLDPPTQSGEIALGAGVAAPSRPGAGRTNRGGLGLMIVLVSASFALYGSWRSPIPGVNEPHYLCKARHFWDPAWCGRDLFLESSNPHWVFYATVGSLTQVLSLEQAARVGRALVWGALAVGWVALARRLVSGRWGVVWGCAFFLALSATGNLSGEWLIGGVEAKGFAYAALFLGLAAACRARWIAAAAWCGAAVSIHPVVGVWGALALVFARGWQWWDDTPRASYAGHPSGSTGGASPVGARIVHVLTPALICGLFSLPGLIPAFALLIDGAPPEVSRAADELQVFHRLDHHLDPKQFKSSGWVLYAVLLTVWLATQPWRARDAGGRLFFRFVVGTLLIAVAGMSVGFGPRWASVLKFYPFRLADLFLPIAVALAAVRLIESLAKRVGSGAAVEAVVRRSSETLAPPTPTLPPQGAEGEKRTAGMDAEVAGRVTDARRSWPLAAGHVMACAAFAWAVVAPGNDRNPTGWSVRQRADWLDVCRWISVQTPADALCLTPRFRNYTFKWYAERAEYAIWKDCPQDAASLVEWQRRLDLVRRWRAKHYKTGFTEPAIAELHDATEVDYIIDWYVQPYHAEPVYRNNSFRVYQAGEPAMHSVP